MKRFLFFYFLLFICMPVGGSEEFYEDRLKEINLAINAEIARKQLPGAVLWLERNDDAVRRAYGNRSLIPQQEKMSLDTVFDLASLTKVIATTPAVMQLVERGKIALDKPISHYFPELGKDEKKGILVRHLLTHVSGFPAGIGRGDWQGKQGAWEKIVYTKLLSPPGARFRYSDINFIALGMLVEKVSGQSLDEYCHENIYKPLQMADTFYQPLEHNIPLERIAPTEQLYNGEVLRGVVHDPTARKMGGVAGHAGLFSTAADLAIFCKMMLAQGEWKGVRIFRPETVKLMTSVASPKGLPRRGLGWDIDSAFAGQRGALFPRGGYGHTGWTGTNLWIDPFSDTFLLLLSNRNHPRGGNILPLRYKVGTLAAQSVKNFNMAWVPNALPTPLRAKSDVVETKQKPVLNGIDVLVRNNFEQLKGLNIGLITNQTGIDRERRSTIQLLHQASGVNLKALFSPEHGMQGLLDQKNIADGRDSKTGLPIYSLYGESRIPTKEQLRGLDALVFDIQDIGTRFYTYISTMAGAMQAAGENGLGFVVLDRLNPIGPSIEGPVHSQPRSFVGIHEIPIRHGMTVGELANLINRERNLVENLRIIPCEGASPLSWFDETTQPWQNPSPNIRNPHQALLYPGVGILEFCEISVGRGTDTPFEHIGAPYIDAAKLATEMSALNLPGVRFTAVEFTPDASKFKGELCRGLYFTITDREKFRAVDLGVALATALQRNYPNQFKATKMIKLIGDKATLVAIMANRPLSEIKELWREGLQSFEQRRQPSLFYPR